MYKKYLKRILDLLCAVIGLPFFILILIIVAPLIFLYDRGPVFYCGERLGKNGKTFRMYKFRSMKVNAPDLRNSDGTTFNSANDPRVTPIGRILRKTSLDETAQILNILKGDMSIVGPRAFLTTRFHGMEYLNEEEKLRLSVLPGITGYCQAYYRNAATHDEKVHYDAYYAENISFALDVKILLRTIKTILSQKNVYTN